MATPNHGRRGVGSDTPPHPPNRARSTRQSGGGLQRYSAKILHAQGQSGGTEIPHLEILGRPDLKVFLQGLSHMVSADPKAGKTEFLAALCLSWADMGWRVAYYSEEPLVIWEKRLGLLPEVPDGFDVIPAMGTAVGGIAADVVRHDDDIVVIDTLKLLRIMDTSDESQVSEALMPLILACRDRGATLIVAHHLRKQGGAYGKGVSGSHAFLAVVDLSIELERVPRKSNRRSVSGVGRLIEVPAFSYDKSDDGLEYVGLMTDIILGALKSRFVEVMPDKKGRMKQVDLVEAIGEPEPSATQAKKALDGLVEDGVVVRDPKESKPGATYFYWRAS